MRKWLDRIFLALAAAFLLMQVYRPARVNPPVDGNRTIHSVIHVPADVAAILDRACADCHSNRTEWPWYSNVAPVGWVVADHVREGRRELNFSEFATYPPDRRAHALEDICEEVKRGSMPLRDYLRLHPEARLSAEDATALCTWARSFTPSLRGDP